jgi:hypothetical protein
MSDSRIELSGEDIDTIKAGLAMVRFRTERARVDAGSQATEETLVHIEDLSRRLQQVQNVLDEGEEEVRKEIVVVIGDGRWCLGTATLTNPEDGQLLPAVAFVPVKEEGKFAPGDAVPIEDCDVEQRWFMVFKRRASINHVKAMLDRMEFLGEEGVTCA